VARWASGKLPFPKDELEFLRDKAGKDIQELQKLAKSLLQKSTLSNSIVLDPSYLNSKEAKPTVDKILKLNEKIESYRRTYRYLKDISDAAAAVSIFITPIALLEGISELLQGHPGDAAMAAVMVIPGARLVRLLKKAELGEKAVLRAEKLTELEEKLQSTRKGSAEFARLEKEIVTERQELQK
jgi:hypothetical protein